MYFASPPISNGAVRSIRLSNPQIRRLCFYPSLRTTRKISRHKSVPLPTRTTDTKYKWRAKGWFAMFCRGWFDYNEWKRDGSSDDLSAIPHEQLGRSRRVTRYFRVKLRQHPRDNLRVIGSRIEREQKRGEITCPRSESASIDKNKMRVSR